MWRDRPCPLVGRSCRGRQAVRSAEKADIDAITDSTDSVNRAHVRKTTTSGTTINLAPFYWPAPSNFRLDLHSNLKRTLGGVCGGSASNSASAAMLSFRSVVSGRL